jgi:hypothetical protein
VVDAYIDVLSYDKDITADNILKVFDSIDYVDQIDHFLVQHLVK